MYLERLEHLLGRRDSRIYVGLGVRQGHEARLVLGGGQVEPALEHATVPLGELGLKGGKEGGREGGREGEIIAHERGEEGWGEGREEQSSIGLLSQANPTTQHKKDNNPTQERQQPNNPTQDRQTPRRPYRVTLGGISEASDRARREEEAEHTADVPPAHLVARSLGLLQDAEEGGKEGGREGGREGRVGVSRLQLVLTSCRHKVGKRKRMGVVTSIYTLPPFLPSSLPPSLRPSLPTR